jgi:hypothetical protein
MSQSPLYFEDCKTKQYGFRLMFYIKNDLLYGKNGTTYLLHVHILWCVSITVHFLRKLLKQYSFCENYWNSSFCEIYWNSTIFVKSTETVPFLRKPLNFEIHWHSTLFAKSQETVLFCEIYWNSTIFAHALKSNRQWTMVNGVLLQIEIYATFTFEKINCHIKVFDMCYLCTLYQYDVSQYYMFNTRVLITKYIQR